jgi:hypothetical protein
MMEKSAAFEAGVKTAIMAWGADVGALGIPSAVGYHLGKGQQPLSKDEAKKNVKKRYSLLAGAFLPGYTGYHFGRQSAARKYLNKERPGEE